MSPPDVSAEEAAPGPAGTLAIRDCAMTALATGRDARTLRELRDRLRTLPDGCLYYHFWGRLLRPVYRKREFNNDFANWAGHQLRDRVLAERLAMVDPADYPGMEGLKDELVELVEERLAEVEDRGILAADDGFHFLDAELVVFDTHRRVETPAELAELCPDLSASSIFYHFVDARQRNPDGVDDFQRWLRGFGEPCAHLCDLLRNVDVYFSTLDDLRDDVVGILCSLDPERKAARV